MVRVYGNDQVEVRALDGVTVEFAAAGVAGVVAAIVPSRRAAQLSIFRAIVSE